MSAQPLPWQGYSAKAMPVVPVRSSSDMRMNKYRGNAGRMQLVAVLGAAAPHLPLGPSAAPPVVLPRLLFQLAALRQAQLVEEAARPAAFVC